MTASSSNPEPAAFAHDAVVQLVAGADRRAPGAAVTVALCGHWQHPPPCPLAPHAVTATEGDGGLQVRILFAAAPEQEAAIREVIDAALRGGRQTGPDGALSRWQLISSHPSVPNPEETGHCRRLLEGMMDKG